MPVRCTVCGSSFKESNALEMHKAAKCHYQSAAGNASGEKTSRDQAQTKPNPSNTAASTVSKVASSGGLHFRCNSCERSFRSREALEAHAEAKAHPLTITAKIKRPEEAPFRCDVCSRYDLGSQNALSDHKRNSKGHQTGNQHSAPPKMLSNSWTRIDQGLPLSDGHSSALSNFADNKTCERYQQGTSREGQKQQNMPLSNARIHHPLALGYGYHSGNAASCQFRKTCTNSKDYAIDAVSQQAALAKDDSDGVPPAIPTGLISHLAITEDLLTLAPPNSQLSSKLVDVYGSVRPKPLEHLGKEWSTMSLSGRPFALKVLRDLCHSVSDLERNGYRLRQYTLTDLMGGQKCKACKRQQGDIRRHKIPCKANLGKHSRFSLHHDLDVLGMLHTRIVDSAILAAKAIDIPSAKTLGLKKMCKEMLNVDIQCLSGGIHDCLEDVIASRELVLYFIHNPEEVQTWALSKRKEELEKEARVQRQRKDRTATTSSQDKRKKKRMVTEIWDDVSDLFDEEEDHEVLRWEDMAEDLGWPHPDTGYDPWSD